MDKMKEQLALVKQHSFWAMCLGILGVSLGSWWVSTGKLQSEQTAQVGKIKSGFDNINTVMGQQKHPNDSTIKGMEAVNRKYAEEVLRGWQLQYDQQVGVLQWPVSFEKTGFRAYVDKLRPIERIAVTDGKVNFKDDLPRQYKIEYRDYMVDELPKLAETIRARWTVATQGDPTSGGGIGGGLGGPGAFGGGATVNPNVPIDPATGQPMLTDDSVVYWNPQNQQEILVTHFGFTMKNTQPSTLEVLYAQEDYWVLDNIMQIIRATNSTTNSKGEREDCTARHDAVIKYLDFVRISRSAYGAAGQVYPVGRSSMMSGDAAGGTPGPGSEGSGTPAPGGPGGDTPPGGSMPGGPGAEGSGGADALLARDPALRRYVDDKYLPLDPTRLRGALKSTTPEDALLAVAKRLPVRIRAKIDQRKLNVFLAECGNAKLPVEVRQVRINRPPATAGMMGGGSFAGGGEGAPMPGGMGGGMPGGFGGGMPGGFGSPGGGGESGGFPGGGMPGGFGGGMPGGFGGGMPGGFGGGMPGGSLGGGMPGGGELGGMPGSGKRGAIAGSVTEDANVDPNLIDVEVYGIVYIYNPANREQLFANQAPAAPEGTPPTDAGVPVATPAPAEVTPAPAEVTPPAEAAAAAAPAQSVTPVAVPAGGQ